MSEIRIAVTGAAGRMGRELVRVISETPGSIVSGGTESPGSPHIGADIGTVAGLPPLGIAISADPLEIVAKSDAIIDFTSPAATVEIAGLAANARIVHVIGTTGLTETDEAAIKAAARHATVIKAGNMSLGVNLLTAITRRIAQALDETFDIEVVEMHHRQKVDAPSGTALMLGAAAAEGRGIDLKTHSVHTRDGHTGPRKRGDIGFATLRGGTVVGDHTVVFAGDGERIEITHRAADRSIFARGAVKAAHWGQGKGPGLFNMGDVLGL
ncbi:4-hydroxy-tetrahydrodipicolinate reductase [Hyphomicrobium sp.]|uniref:4-hydroxy-tetrahydrodipicolinate reductase n=1 Tax=Hyphomicrobium sp. TaxID=82 RepID=UPI002E32767F|nr:4-hydroxy-tetrahydrodipicolinate reductase [Hyphomicrobium sp.]HEX2840649.1 4-hydroxy-tetrahydrodipicolinate reductase [Hyphomicrobium sp.]